MASYIVRRLLQLPIILFGVSVLIFAMLMLVSPFERLFLYVPDRPQDVDVERLVEFYGLNRPIYVQYWDWLQQVFRGDLGFSHVTHQPVTEALAQYLPATLELTLWSVVPVLGVGIQLGVWAAVHHEKMLDHVLRIFAIIGWSFPTYVFGLMALMIFYAQLDWFPAGRLSEQFVRVVQGAGFNQYTRMHSVDSLLNGRFDIFLDSLRHLILPVVTLSYLWWAQILRVTRSSMLEALRQDYVTTARAKGLPERVVINKHVRRNAMIPVATIGSLTVVGLMSGVVITETVFNIRGLGYFFAESALNLDIASVLGFTLFYSTLVVIGNLTADMLYAVLDPRVRYT